jgi:hypothetical protein
MVNTAGRGIQHSPTNSFSRDNSNVNGIAFTVEVKFSNPVDFYWDAAATYLDMFGVTRNDEVLKSWTLFTNQYEKDVAENYILDTADFFRKQIYFQTQAAIPNVRHYTLKIEVPQGFVDRLKDFGIEVSFNPAFKSCTVTKFDPIKMVAWSDLQPADIFCVGGTGIASRIIRAGTWTFSSHTALYEGSDLVIESLDNGITRRSKAEFLSPSEGVNIIFVKRHRDSAGGKGLIVVNAAKDNVNDGIPPYGKNRVKYNWTGLAGAGMSSQTGAVIGATTPVIGAVAGINEANNLAREITNAIPDAAIAQPGDLGKAVIIGKSIWGGPKGRLFCTEAVITWYNEANIPITSMQPDHVPPKFVAENYFNDTLLELGYLRYMPL